MLKNLGKKNKQSIVLIVQLFMNMKKKRKKSPSAVERGRTQLG